MSATTSSASSSTGQKRKAVTGAPLLISKRANATESSSSASSLSEPVRVIQFPLSDVPATLQTDTTCDDKNEQDEHEHASLSENTAYDPFFDLTVGAT
mmetsp:Transcript_20066/g.50907  ORF Transcript_20066/g.50907 Transcript_20066/m.50907 type:complete len:98 (-) Transcript_20066:88-381(-)